MPERQFNGIWYDYILEATENKELNGSGGIIGLTMKGAAVTWWFLSWAITAQYSSMFHDEIQVMPSRLMPFENSPVPLSLFSEGGTMLSGTKSDFLHKLESLVETEPLTTARIVDALIYDGHATIHT